MDKRFDELLLRLSLPESIKKKENSVIEVELRMPGNYAEGIMKYADSNNIKLQYFSSANVTDTYIFYDEDGTCFRFRKLKANSHEPRHSLDIKEAIPGAESQFTEYHQNLSEGEYNALLQKVSPHIVNSGTRKTIQFMPGKLDRQVTWCIDNIKIGPPYSLEGNFTELEMLLPAGSTLAQVKDAYSSLESLAQGVGAKPGEITTLTYPQMALKPGNNFTKKEDGLVFR